MSYDGRRMLAYTTQVGGSFILRALSSAEEFDKVVAEGLIDVTPADEDTTERIYVKPKFVVLLRVDRNHDFVLGCSRDDNLGIAQYEIERAAAA